MSTWQQRASLIILLGLSNSPLNAREAYLRDVPSPFACTTCHEDPRGDRQGANIRNGFGFDYVAQRQEWSRLCDLDSDGDGITNATELLDPNCEWRPAPAGQPNPPRPAGQATHPGDPDDPDQCGDGEIQGREECDGDNLDGSTCESLGFLDGQLSCDEACTFDQTTCSPFPMPDMMADVPDATPAEMKVPDVQVLLPDATLVDMQAQMDAADQIVATENDLLVEASVLSDSAPSVLDSGLDEGAHDGAVAAVSRSTPACTHSPDVMSLWFIMLGVLAVRRIGRCVKT